MNLALQGNIERFTLPEIFQLLAMGRKSGTLGIQREDSIVMVYFKEGSIVYGYGPRQTYHLGQLLKDRGVLTAEQLEQAIRVQSHDDNTHRLGAILISRGFIDRSDLESAVRQQVEELLYSLLSWENGSFKFYENQYPTDEEITVQVSVENVILEGLRRLDELNMSREALGDAGTVYALATTETERLRDVSFRGAEWNVMTLVNGFRTVSEIVAASQMGPNDTLRVLAQLKLAGMITPAEVQQKPPTSEIDGQINRLARLFEDYLTEKTTSRLDPNMLKTTSMEQNS
ncbi:MAG: DUF4388 domain-containing protein [Candidatus Zixiibacteriota bacterium]